MRAYLSYGHGDRVSYSLYRRGVLVVQLLRSAVLLLLLLALLHLTGVRLVAGWGGCQCETGFRVFRVCKDLGHRLAFS